MQIIHREGHRFLLKTLAIAIAIVFGGFKFFESCFVQYSILGITIFFWLIFLQFFRNPSFQKVTGEKSIIAPADGEVVVIENVQETEYFKGERTQISIFMTPLNVHVNRNPVGGVVKYFKYHEGKYMVASHPKSSTENERTTTVIENSNGIEILFRQVAGALARRICWYIKEGDQVAQSDEMGFIKFGSRVDIYVPTTTKINVKLGDKTKGGRTVIAELV
jgi:phosphatidylserine decarboxylase